jgi:hypothetical protein
MANCLYVVVLMWGNLLIDLLIVIIVMLRPLSLRFLGDTGEKGINNYELNTGMKEENANTDLY